MTDVFISYSRRDKQFVARLNEQLKQSGKETWVDWEGIMPSEEWLKEIYSAIESSDCVVFVLSPDSITSEVCGQEIEHAVNNNKRLIPIVYRDVVAKDVPRAAASHNWIFFRDSDDYDASFKLLLKAIDIDTEWVREHTRLLTRAIEWSNNKRDASFMVNGRELQRAEQWLAKAGSNVEPHPTPLQTEYILNSRRIASMRQFRLVTSVTILVFIGIILLLLVKENKQRANIYLAQELQSKAIWALTDHDVHAAEVLLAKSMTLDDRPETRERFLEARSRSSRLARVISNPNSHVLAISQDGSWYAIGQNSGAIEFGHINVKQGFVSLPIQPSSAVAVAFSSDESIAGIILRDRVTIWETATGKLLHSIPAKSDAVQCLAFSADGKLLATSGKDLIVRVWDTKTAQLVHQYKGHTEQVSALAFSPDGKLLASAGWSHEILVFDVKSEQKKARLIGHEDIIHSLTFSPDGSILASGSGDTSIRLWDIKKGILMRVLEGSTASISCFAFSSDGRQLYSGDDSGKVRAWDVHTGHNLVTISAHSQRVNSISYVARNRLLMTGSDDGMVNVWDIAYTDHKAELITLRGHNGVASMVAFAPDGKRLASTGEDGFIRLWDAAKGECLRVFAGHKSGVESVAFTRDGAEIATGSRDNTVRVWQTDTGKTIKVLKHPGSIRWVLFCDKDKYLASGCDDGNVRIYSTDNWGLVNKVQAGDTVLSLAYNGNNDWLASGSQDGNTRIWDKNFRQIASLDPSLVDSEKYRLNTHRGVWGVGFTDDPPLLISGCEDGYIRIWDVNDKKEIRRIQSNQGAVWDVALGSQGREVATAGQDSTVKVFAIKNDQSITLRAIDGAVWGIDYNANGSLLAAGGQDWTVRVWNMPQIKRIMTEDPRDLLAEVEQETGLTVVDHDVAQIPLQKLNRPFVYVADIKSVRR